MSSSSPNLLSLPRELRDQIYLYATSNTYDRSVFNPQTTHGQWQSIPLLATNHQLRSEVQDFIAQQHKAHAINFSLSCQVKGYIHIPTWTHLNYALQPREIIDNLHLHLIILSTESFRRNDGWPRQPGQIFRDLLHDLNSFLFHGPSFTESNPKFQTPGPHFIRCLEIQMTFRDPYTPGTHPEAVYEMFRMLKALTLLDTAHKYLGRIRVRAEFGHEKREAEWDVSSEEEAVFTEQSWADMGFWFGEEWREKRRREVDVL